MEYTPLLKPIDRGASMRPPFELEWRQGVLLRSTNWLGDALMTIPAAYQIRRCVPEECGFFVVAPKFLAPLWRACPWVDHVVEMAGKRLSADEARDARGLRAGVSVVFPNSLGSAWDMRKCGTPARVGRSGRFRGWLLTHRLPEWPAAHGQADRHQLSYYLEIAASLGKIDWTMDYPSLQVDTKFAIDLGMATDEDWLGIAPGAAFGPAKQWPAEYYAAVAKQHVARGGRVVFVGTAKEAPVTSQLAMELPGSLDMAGKTSLTQLMAILARCRRVVANDSGAMHLAAALGTPGVAIFGSTDTTGKS